MNTEKRIKNPKFYEYESRLLTDLDFLESSKAAQAEALGVDRETTRRWADDIDWARVAESARRLYAREFPAVASALLKRIRKNGDPRAVELFWQRMDRWSPKSSLEVSKGGPEGIESIPTDDLVAMALRTLPPGELEAVIGRARALPDPSEPPVPGPEAFGMWKSEADSQSNGNQRNSD